MLLLHGIAKREASALQERIQQAKLPFHKSIHEFGFTFQSSISEQQVKEVLRSRKNKSMNCIFKRSYYERIYSTFLLTDESDN
nr:ATP-binding protein [Bacillus toyonensis]